MRGDRLRFGLQASAPTVMKAIFFEKESVLNSGKPPRPRKLPDKVERIEAAVVFKNVSDRDVEQAAPCPSPRR
jgi:hypothetical protein